VVALLLLGTGLTLTRGLPGIELRNPDARELAYWLHIAAPFMLVWLFVLHRLAGRAIRWRAGASVLGVAAALSVVAIVVQSQDPRQWNQQGPADSEAYFSPSLARTASGNFIPADALMNDEYCQGCHADTHAAWSVSMHRFSSFNNPIYHFSVSNTRNFLEARDGDIHAVRFCAGCHDPVPFFSGAMDDPTFGDLSDPRATAGITCTSCHAITNVNSVRGNAAFTIEAPLHYPFANSDEPWLRWVSDSLVKAKPAFHKKTFLKPLHESAEFCSTCHKVHLPEELNAYKWLRGQNHYDSFLLSGVSGHGIQSFNYPQQAQPNCNGCHMPDQVSEDFGAELVNGELTIHNHQFAAGNTGIPHLLGFSPDVQAAHREMLRDSVTVDIYGLREDGRIDGELAAPLYDGNQVLEAGKTYLLEIVLRTRTLGHHFTQGTADSNEVWLQVQAAAGEDIIGESGTLLSPDNRVDPWSHFVNAYVIDRDGNRIDRRNPENIFTQLYNNQIPPGAADVVRYRLTVPEDHEGPINIEARLNYRKFDASLMAQALGAAFATNDLPITTISSDSISLASKRGEALDFIDEARTNDYGIGLFRRQQFRQAEEAFKRVELTGDGKGSLNLARVYLAEGRLDDAAAALERAAINRHPAPPWSISYFTAQLNFQNGFIDEAIDAYIDLIGTQYEEAQNRGFDFSRDYRLLNDLATALAERAKFERNNAEAEETIRRQAVSWYQQALTEDPENVTAHYGLTQLYEQLGEDDLAAYHRRLHSRYRVDDNARDRAVQLARRMNPAADHAANTVVIYDLHRTAQ
ncbi:MAG: tetratricopeptide repeat protein, partial [Pseudomonadota bacterium]